MQCHRIEELLELLQAEWLQDQDLTLLQFLQKVANEAGFPDALDTISDDTLIYQLKMRSRGETEMIPGLAKDAVPDFKEAILRARGIIK
nr:YihD family protein [uncultured Tolumonas sp.]